MIDDKTIRNVLRLLFAGEDYVQMYEIIDHDMIRKPAIRIQKRKELENYDESYTVTINWRLLNRFIDGGEE